MLKVEVVLKSVVGQAGIADVGDSLTVCRGVVGVPHQLQFVVGGRAGGTDTVGPCTTTFNRRIYKGVLLRRKWRVNFR